MGKNKKGKVVDLSPKAEKITTQQLERVQKAVSGINRVKVELGALELQKHNLLHVANDMQSELGRLQEEFVDNYGTANIDISDGSIKYDSDEQADKKD